MTEHLDLRGPAGDALDAVTDADRAWFDAHPARRYRVRPVQVAELLPGQEIVPGSRMLVVNAAPGMRIRLLVRAPLRLRQDTDRCGQALVWLLDRHGCTWNGVPLQRAIAEVTAALAPVAEGSGAPPAQGACA